MFKMVGTMGSQEEFKQALHDLNEMIMLGCADQTYNKYITDFFKALEFIRDIHV